MGGENVGTTTSGPEFTPGLQGTGEPGVLGNAVNDGGIGVIGDAGNGVGVYGGVNSNVGVVGVTAGRGAGVVGWAGAGVLIDGGVIPVDIPPSDTVGVYGHLGGATLKPSKSDVSCGVWGDAVGGANATGVLGCSDADNQSGTAGVDTSPGGGHGAYGRSNSGAGVYGASESGQGGVFESSRSAQVRLIPSSTPLTETALMQTGQPGDLYLFSAEHEVDSGAAGTGTESFTTSLWLCIWPKTGPGEEALWAQVQLGDTVGG
jgi:hypothetical protein